VAVRPRLRKALGRSIRNTRNGGRRAEQRQNGRPDIDYYAKTDTKHLWARTWKKLPRATLRNCWI